MTAELHGFKFFGFRNILRRHTLKAFKLLETLQICSRCIKVKSFNNAISFYRSERFEFSPLVLCKLSNA